ncbi:hypothetical protein SLE2022_278320 [Rubroshorea leprosula]
MSRVNTANVHIMYSICMINSNLGWIKLRTHHTTSRKFSRKVGYATSNQFVDPHLLIKRIAIEIGKSLGLRCKNSATIATLQLVEVGICFSRRGTTLIDCPSDFNATCDSKPSKTSHTKLILPPI